MVLVDNRIVDRRHRRPPGARRARRRRARRRARRAWPTSSPASATPTTVERSSERLGRRALQPVHAGARRRGRAARSSRSTSTSTSDEFPARRRRGAVACARTPTARLAAHVLGYVGPINDEELEARRTNRDKPYKLNDEIGKSGVERATRTTCGARRGAASSRSTPTATPSASSSYRPPVPGNDLVAHHRHRRAGRGRAGAGRGARDQPATARSARTGPRRAAPAGSVVVLDPQRRAVLAMASFPTFDPADVRRRHRSDEWAALQRPGGARPAEQPGHPGPVRARARRSSSSPRSPGCAAGLIIARDDASSTTASYRLPDCTGDTCVFRNAGPTPHGRVDLRRALTVSSDVYFYDLGARFWIERGTYGDPIQDDGPRLRPRRATPASRCRPSTPGASRRREQAGRATTTTPTAFPDGDVARGRQRQHRHRPGRGAGHAAPARQRLRHLRQRRHPVLAQRRPPMVEAGTGAPTTGPAHDRTPGDPPDRRSRPSGATPILDGLIGVTTASGGTAGRAFAGFPNWTVAGKTGTAQVNDKADTALFAAFGPAEAPSTSASRCSRSPASAAWPPRPSSAASSSRSPIRRSCPTVGPPAASSTLSPARGRPRLRRR